MKKKFEKPELEITLFANEEIIVTSSDGEWGDDYGQGGDDWNNND